MGILSSGNLEPPWIVIYKSNSLCYHTGLPCNLQDPLAPKDPESQQHSISKGTWKKEIIKIRFKIIKIGNKINSMSKTKSWFFENIFFSKEKKTSGKTTQRKRKGTNNE